MANGNKAEETETQNYYKLSKDNTVTVEGCPFCGQTHIFSIETQWETIQKSNIQQSPLPDGVKKFIVECPKERSLFEIYIKVK